MLPSVTNEQVVSSTNLNDVLCYIKSAGQLQLRVIQIALENSDKFIPRKKKVSFWEVLLIEFSYSSSLFFKCLFNKLFYVRSFRITSLSGENKKKCLDYCNKYDYSVMDVRFKRRSLDHFRMWYLGDDRTYMGYCISSNTIEG